MYVHLDVTTLASLGANNLWGSIQRAEGENNLWGSIQRAEGTNNLRSSIRRAWVRTTCGVRFSEPKVVVKLVGVSLHNFGF